MDQANKTKDKVLPKGHINRLRRFFLGFPKSHIYLLTASLLGIVVALVVAVFLVTSGPQIVKKFPKGPCDNFHKFSCQLWIEQNPRPEFTDEWNVLSVLSRKSNKLVSDILEEPHQYGDIDGLRQAKILYKNCLSYYSEETSHTEIKFARFEMPLVEQIAVEIANNVPTNEFCSEVIQNQFASVVVHKYIKQKYPDIHQFEEIRKEVQQMFDNIKMVFDNADSPFFSELAKNTELCIGFPDWLLNSTKVQSKYDGFLLNEDDEFEMQVLKTSMWKVTQDLRIFVNSTNTAECWKYHSDITYAADKTETVYPESDTSSTLIYIPLERLEPQLFQIHRSKAMNYGSLGTIIGHELAHAYLGNDWEKSMDETLLSLGECLEQQYSTFTSDDSIALNGELTLEENLVDNLGLLASYIAYSKINGKQHYTDIIKSLVAFYNTSAQQLRPTDSQTNQLTLTELTDDQIFFLSFSQAWCESNSKTFMEEKMQTSTHAPGIFRVLGTLENSEEFAKSWNCSKQSKSCQSLLAKIMEISM